MDFFEHQERARRTTRWLILLYLLAVAGIVLVVNAGVGLAWVMAVWPLDNVPAGTVSAAARAIDRGAPGSALALLGGGYLLQVVPQKVYWASTGITLLVILGASLYKVGQLAEGGESVAGMLGAARVAGRSQDPLERRLLNVVEEMAIAAGVSVPPVYVMNDEPGINAFAAGYAPNQAVVAVTRGALEQLNRDELQGVIGHEFSHILNGDMRLNIHLIGVLHGIVFIGQVGEFLLRSLRHRGSGNRDDARVAAALALVGLVLMVIGYLGLFFARLIKAAISRQREFLADASGVQFTRNPDGLAGALDRIAAASGAHGAGSEIRNLHAEEMSHLFFGQSVNMWFSGLFATHPPLEERIARVRPGFAQTRYRRARPQSTAGLEAYAAGSGAQAAAGFAAPAGAAAEAPTAQGWGASNGLSAAVGRLGPEEVDMARRVLGAIPAPLREAARGLPGAAHLALAMALDADVAVRTAQRELIEAARGADDAAAVFALRERGGALARAWVLPLTELALPALKSLPQAERDLLLAQLESLAQVDRRVTLSEFVLLTYLRQGLRAGAGRPPAARYRDLRELEADALVLLAVLAHAGRGDTASAHAQALEAAGLAPAVVPQAASLTLGRVGEALERLRLLAPLAKPRLLKACLAAAEADGIYRVAEVELLRTVAATLDCPLPPVIESLDPASLAA